MKTLTITILLFLISLFLYSDEVDQNTIMIDESKAVELFIKNNLELKESNISLENNKIDLATVWNDFIPQTKLGLSYSNNSTTSNVDYTDAKYNNYETVLDSKSRGLNINTSYDLKASYFFNIVNTYLEYKSGKISYLKVKQNIKYEVRKSFYNLLVLEEQVKYKKEEVSNAEEKYKKNLIKFEAQMISEIDKLNSEYNYLSLQPELEDLNNQYQYMLSGFKNMLGIDNDRKIILVGELNENIDSESFETLVNKKFEIERNIDLQDIHNKIKIYQNARNNSISELTPTFSIGYNYDYSLDYSEKSIEEKSMDKTDQNYNNQTKSGILTLSLTFGLDNLLPFSRSQKNIIKYSNEIKSAKYELENKKNKLKTEVDNIIAKINMNIQLINLHKKNYEIALKSYLLVEKLYDAGSRDFLELNDARDKLNKSKLSLLKAKFDLYTSYIDLEKILNIE